MSSCSVMFGLPAAAVSVGNQSSPEKIPFSTVPGLICARPADDARHAEAAFADRALGVLERRHAAIRPGEHLGAVVGGEDDDGVVGFADVVEVLEQGADAVIDLRHAGFFETVVGLAVLHRAVLLGEERPDVHARGVVPDEERLAVLLGLVHEVARSLDQHLVEGRHVVLRLQERQVVHVRHVRHVRERRQRAFVDDPLLADLAPARHLGRDRRCRSHSSGSGCAGHTCCSSPGRPGTNTSTGRTSRRGDTDSRRTRRSRAGSADTCSGHRDGSCRTARWHSPAP